MALEVAMFRGVRYFSSALARRAAHVKPAGAPVSNSKLAFGLMAGSVLGAGISYQFISNRSANEDRKESSKDVVPTSLDSTLPLANLALPEYASPVEFSQALDKITNIVGKEHVSTGQDVLQEHDDSDWMFRRPLEGEGAQAVAYPANAEEVSQIVKVCHEYRVPVVPFSGGTSLEGHFTPVYKGISIDLNRMSNIVAIHEEDMDVVVQPAVSWQDLAEVLHPKGLQFGPDPGPGAQIGGMIGTNASGTNAYAQGVMRHNVLGLTIVLADGTIVKTRRRPRKSSAGYDLTSLVVGSEGTLGIVVEATLRLNSYPKFRKLGLLAFPDIKDAADMVQAVLRSGYKLDAMELLDDDQMKFLNKSGMTDRKWDEDNTLLLKFGGPSESYVNMLVEEVKRLSHEHHASNLIFPKDEDEADELWTARKDALISILSLMPQGYKTIGTDAAVPISHLSTYIHDVHEEIRKRGLTGSVIGHVGDGNFHCLLAYNPDTDMTNVHDFVNWTAERAISLDGTCTGEHGIGMGKRKLVLDELGAPAIDMMRQIKFALDPQMIMNPGKIFSIQRVGDKGDDLPFVSCHGH